MSAFDTFLAGLSGRATDSGVAAMGVAQAPTTDELAEDSAERAAMVGGHQADGPDLEPIYEAAEPVTTDVTEHRRPTAPSVLDGPPAPAASVGFTAQSAADTPAMILSASDRPRRITLVNLGTGVAYIAPERRDGTPGNGSGFQMPTGTTPLAVVMHTTGQVWAVSAAALVISVWVDYLDAEG